MSTFREDIERAINRHCRENRSDTPDYVLSQYICDCMAAYDRAVKARAASRNGESSGRMDWSGDQQVTVSAAR